MMTKQFSGGVNGGTILSRKKTALMLILVLILSVLMTGCQKLNETFGKEYIMIDDFYEQLEADLRFTLEEYISEQDYNAQEKADAEANLELGLAQLKVSKEELKLAVSDYKEMNKEMNVDLPLDVYIEKGLLETRMIFEKKISEASGGTVTLQKTKIQRGLLGSIWHFVRSHWLISLIILGVISAAYESISEFAEKNRKMTGENEKKE